MAHSRCTLVAMEQRGWRPVVKLATACGVRPLAQRCRVTGQHQHPAADKHPTRSDWAVQTRRRCWHAFWGANNKARHAACPSLPPHSVAAAVTLALPALLMHAPPADAAVAGMLPLMFLFSADHPLWLQLGALILANVLGFQVVLAMVKQSQDRSEPVTLVRLQLGLVHALHGPAAHSIEHLRSRLIKLNSMMNAGQHGMWLILEEAVLELSKQQKSAALADIAVVHMQSKHEAYDLFNEVSRKELIKAKAEEVKGHAEGQGECNVDWEDLGGGQDGEAPLPGQALLSWITSRGAAQPQGPVGCQDTLVVTLVVAARGNLDIPTSASTWSDLVKAMKMVCGLSSDRLMAVDLCWAPSTDGSYLTREMLATDYTNLRPIKH